MQDLIGETDIQCPGKKRFAEWARWEEDGIITDVITGSVEWEVGNVPTAGEEFGILIISRAYQEGNHFGEGYQRVSNLQLAFRKPHAN